MELGAVGRTICILETLSKVKTANLETLSKETGLPKATALRLLTALVEQGYVSRDESDRYSLTLRMFSVGSRALRHVELLDVANPVAGRLRDDTGETVHMGILESDRAVYILKRESLYTIRMNSRIGKSIPLHCSGIGKCLLASQRDSYIREYINGGLRRYTPNTICEEDELLAELEAVRAKGYAVDDEEIEEGVYCIASPIHNAYGETVAAMSLSTPTFRLDRDNIEALVEKVKSSCDSISRVLGYINEHKQ